MARDQGAGLTFNPELQEKQSPDLPPLTHHSRPGTSKLVEAAPVQGALWLELTLSPEATTKVKGLRKDSAFQEKALAPHSSTLAWKISWMEEPGRLQSMGPLRVGHD